MSTHPIIINQIVCCADVWREGQSSSMDSTNIVTRGEVENVQRAAEIIPEVYQ